MASPDVIYLGGELETVTPISGSVNSVAGRYDPQFSDCSIALRDCIFGEIFRGTDGLPASVSGGDELFSTSYMGGEGGYTTTWLTIYDNSDRPALRLFITDSSIAQLQHNTGSVSSPTWSLLGSGPFPSGSYVAFRIKTGGSKSFALFINGSETSSGLFSNDDIGPLSRFTAGPSGYQASISQIAFSRGVNLVGARLMTRKADGVGTYSQMAGSYTDLVKTTINDATAVTSNSAGQIFTAEYQNIAVPSGLIMHPIAWIWNRVKNDGAPPTSIKQASIINGSIVRSQEMPVDVGFKGLPTTISGLTPEIWNNGEIGMESVS